MYFSAFDKENNIIGYYLLWRICTSSYSKRIWSLWLKNLYKFLYFWGGFKKWGVLDFLILD